MNLRLDLSIPNGTLDAWQHRPVARKPTVIAIPGGGWIKRQKEGFNMQTLPFLAKGMAVVNIEYRLAWRISGARRGGRLSLRAALGFPPRGSVWIRSIADCCFWGIRGGHLSLMTGMLRMSDGFDGDCPAEPGETELHVAAIVDFGRTTSKGLPPAIYTFLEQQDILLAEH